MRLKALLVDDETKILDNLQLVLPWRELDIEVVGLAKNGVQALELVEKHKPDIILCDIRMPVMDGIGFLEALSDTDSQAAVVMLTGYQDFEYARSVIRLGARDYILKPFDYDELTSVIERLAGAIRTKRVERTSEEQMLGQAMDLAYEKLLYDMIMDYGAVIPHDMVAENMNELEHVRYVMLLADFQEYAREYRLTTEQNRKLWNFAIRNVLKDTLSMKGLRHAVLQTREGEWCILVERRQSGGVMTEEEGRRLAELLRKSVLEHVKIGLSFGIHLSNLTMEELPKAFKSLQRSVHLAGDAGSAVLVCSPDGSRETSRSELWETMDDLVSALKQCDRGKVGVALQRLNRQFLAISEQSLSHVEKLAYFIVLHLLREMRELDVLSAAEEQEIWAMMEQADRVKDLLAVVGRIADDSLRTAMGKKTGDVLMHAAKDYIHRGLSGDLGVDETAHALGISSSYFSLLFKQHFGCTFVEYVTSERVEMAKSMLLLTEKSVTEISRLVGYSERRYFNKVFQKLTGEIPSEYREKRKNGVKEGT
jgi:two-component system, response regulator YesN